MQLARIQDTGSEHGHQPGQFQDPGGSVPRQVFSLQGSSLVVVVVTDVVRVPTNVEA